MNDVLATIIFIGGWVGAAEFLLGYFLISRNRIAGDSLKYQALNISGSVLLMTNCAYTGAWPSAISNVFYLFVGVTILFTVKRAYIAQLAHRRREELAARRAAARARRGALATAELAELSLIEA